MGTILGIAGLLLSFCAGAGKCLKVASLALRARQPPPPPMPWPPTPNCTPRRFPLLAIAPEATTKAQPCLLKFRRGAFSAGQPVCPVLLRYRYRHFNPGGFWSRATQSAALRQPGCALLGWHWSSVHTCLLQCILPSHHAAAVCVPQPAMPIDAAGAPVLCRLGHWLHAVPRVSPHGAGGLRALGGCCSWAEALGWVG